MRVRMSASSKLHLLWKRLFGTDSAALTTTAEENPHTESSEAQPFPLFSLGQAKQELVTSFRNVERET